MHLKSKSRYVFQFALWATFGLALASCDTSGQGGLDSANNGAGTGLLASSVDGLTAPLPFTVNTGVTNPAQGTGPAATSSTSTPPAGVGPTCVAGDANKICLAVHFIVYTDPTGAPTATQAQASTIVTTVNNEWSQCDIGFEIEYYQAVDPTQYGLTYDGTAAENQQETIRQTFQSPTNELLAVTTGTWPTAVNAWTNLPGDGVYGSVLEAGIVTYSGGLIYAHEFGHYLGLLHVADTSDLMDPVIYPYSTTLDSDQCQTARSTATSYWSAMIRN